MVRVLEVMGKSGGNPLVVYFFKLGSFSNIGGGLCWEKRGKKIAFRMYILLRKWRKEEKRKKSRKEGKKGKKEEGKKKKQFPGIRKE